ncbi:efflux RND transporter periplasmic adaptor subunit [Sphaerotilus montanus]|uniref:RND family efflux transporter MFP subunit n=1 Tax=Sphaerotilus montanus TaxID=522889 RepID=A0A7Y9U535_9BURK|nr:efflux RND transporter periplasmic adaptor subunit [Sphaerotilus montanus]NYG31256.1 RND family efflux transporter MFP subunit [Sphaerotilus montanus]NZD55242.1 efflux RND transporter periplasmic adaptor subunit [Sphaerotilus montanus]
MRRSALRVAVWLAGGWLAVAGQAAPLACLIEPSQVVDIGSPVVGVIATVAVERGDAVRRGEVVATLRREVERANLSAASSRSEVQAELRAARAAAELARSKLVRAEDLRRQNFISEVAVEQARSEAEVAYRRVDAVREQQRAAASDTETARSQFALRELAATIDGVVVDRFLNPGERVDDKPILRIARLDPLRVELVLPLSDLGRLKAGDTVQIKPDYPGATRKTATVERVDKIVDAASRTFRARLTLPNPDHGVLAGVRCQPEWVSATPTAGPATPAAMPALVAR